MISLKKILLEAAPAKKISEQTTENLEAGKQIVNELINRGFNYTSAVALAGNMSVESMENGKWFQPTASDGKAYGLCQWQGDRLTALRAYAKYKGTGVSSLATQLDFVKFELVDGYLLHPTDKDKKLKQQLVPGIPVNLVYIVDKVGKPSIPRHFTKASTEAKQFERSNKSTIKDTTSALTTNVFRPSDPHVDRRVSNAMAIHNYISNGSSTKPDTSSKQIDNTTKVTEHTVVNDETLGGIANKYNTTVDNLLKLNKGLQADKIRVGQKIRVK